MKLEIVDVFAERRYEGNQLAVVRHAGSLPAATMQAIARELNFSETTFVHEPEASAAQGRRREAAVRIFTPAEELPFAGHPVLGTAWVLCRGAFPMQIAVAAGAVEVWFDDGLAWLEPPQPHLRSQIPADIAARIVGLDAAALDPELPARQLRCGPEFCFVAVKSLESLAAVRTDAAELALLGVRGFPFVVCGKARAIDAQYAARMHFFDGVGMREDPATGSANAAFAAYLCALGKQGRFIVEQGVEMGRPSRIHLEIGERLAVGGRVQPVATGTLE